MTWNFSRWSDRKRRAATDKNAESKSECSPDNTASETSTAPAQDETRLPFDDANLPTLESIGAASDIRAFLEAGVPGDLARAALRRVWSSDPAIRDFVGLSENSGDFNAPGAMAGFGPIDKEEVGRLLTRLFGEEPDTIAATAHPPLTISEAEGSQKAARESNPVEYRSTNTEPAVSRQQLDVDKISVAGEVTRQGRATATQLGIDKSECLPPIVRRRSHGGALRRLLSGGTMNNDE
ncbi:DUF3306 domain-containing protein [Bradyrhizobium sp. BWA-3-5]|uniref:DUF3306 domain-containing protein n=1 Tax=Bradyrhizobium sp. BWA-3-5 TaxID=3080013 RepID=UPI00293E8E2B|nr:DUF3306 domain-containing protein [Bradyrhizobium sp. BWA-3-5]WOH69756.1 DUF3306 domain-containing protein [Bradyrhizobium sp. BWA-3-5]